MRLLVITQAVDRNDPVLGFFHRWIEEFAASVEKMEVICLKKGEYALPSNVSVYSLGKESKPSRVRYVFNFYRHLWRLRGQYDAVLVHMNEEYILLGGLVWLVLGKRMGLWRNHVQGNWKAAIACRIASVVFYTSPQTYASRFSHAHRMSVGVDTVRFVPAETLAPRGTILSLGRLDTVKNVDILLEALTLLVQEQVSFKAVVVGSPTPGREAYAKELKERFCDLEKQGYVAYRTGVRFEDTPHIYASHRVFVNLTPPGSFDKTILEAAACGALVVASNPALKEVIHPSLFVESLTPQRVAEALRSALACTDEQSELERTKLRTYVAQEHSLAALVKGVLSYVRP